jgi:hypothetical protein
VRITETSQPASGASAEWRGEVGGKGLAVLTLPIEGDVVATAQVRRRQFFVAEVLRWVRPGRDVDLRLTVDPEALRSARRATLRFVFERLAAGEGALALGVPGRDARGRRAVSEWKPTLALPSCPTPVNVCWIRDVPIDPALLSQDNVLRFSAAEGHAGYLVAMASVLIEQ